MPGRQCARVRSGWRRRQSVYGVKTVAYLNPDGTHALIAYNSWQSDQTWSSTPARATSVIPLPAGAVVTLVW